MPAISVSQGIWRDRATTFRNARVIVRVEDSVPAGQIDGLLEALAVSHLGIAPANVRDAILGKIGRWAVLGADASIQIPHAAESIENRPQVKWAEPDFVVVGFQPEEPNTEESWATERIGLSGAKANGPTGADHVLIGIVDTGIRLEPSEMGPDPFVVEHEDFDPSRFTLGTDYIDPGSSGDTTTHGTGIAGVIASKKATTTLKHGDDAIVVEGMNDSSPVHVCRVLDDNLNGSVSDVYLAVNEILESSAHGTRCVINLSLGFSDDQTVNPEHSETTLKAMCQLASENGAILVCAAGNYAGTAIRYPAKYAGDDELRDTVMAVGSTTLRSGSFRHAEAVPAGVDEWIHAGACAGPEMTVVAPGHQVPTQVGNSSYDRKNGTSIATSFVTGLVSLVWSDRAELSSKEVIDKIKAGAWLPDGADELPESWGAGRIDVSETMTGPTL